MYGADAPEGKNKMKNTMKNIKKIFLPLLAALLALALSSCGAAGIVSDIIGELPSVELSSILEDLESIAEELIGTESEGSQTTVDPTGAPTVDPTSDIAVTTENEKRALPDKDGYYYDLENVVLYLNTYGVLPGNYITKETAKGLGWPGGTLVGYFDEGAIGGDYFGNAEKLLPTGTKYTECDIGTKGKARGELRLVFSNDKNNRHYYYTDDHYVSFREVIVTENNEVIFK